MGLTAVITGILLTLSGVTYYSLIALFTWGWKFSGRSFITNTVPSGMKVSVIIAARNEEKKIAGLLEDLVKQDYPAGLTDIIVVDDHSEDNTAAVVSDFITNKCPDRLIIIKNKEKSGKKAAITHGIMRSKGELLLFTDADCRLQPGWISALVSGLRDEEKMMIFGPVSYLPQTSLVSKFQSLEFLGLMASGAGASGAGFPFMCNGACLAYRKSAFFRVKGFEGTERFISGDDVFLLHKMKKEFGPGAIGFSHDKNAIAYTFPAENFRKFLDQRIRWASKSMGYRDPVAITTALTVFVYSFINTAIFFAGFVHASFFWLFAGSILIKSLADFPLMWKVTGFTARRKLMKWYLPFQAVYPFYITIAGILSVFNRKNW